MFQEILIKLNQLNFISPIFYKILYLTIIGSIVGLIVCLIRNIFDKKLSGKWRCIMWFVVLASLLIPIRYEIKTNRNIPNNIINNIEDIKYIPEKQVIYHESKHQSFIPEEFLDEKSEINSQIEEVEKDDLNENIEKEELSNLKENVTTNHLSINYSIINIIIPTIWIIGTLTFVFMFIGGVIQIRKKSKKRIFADERINNILENCKNQLNINKKIKVVLQSNGKTSIFGIFSPVILLSENILQENNDTIKYIFLHELSHYKRKDPILNYMLLLTLSIHWFNPIVWFIFMKVREDIELGADELAIEKLNKQEKKEYGLVLINLLQNISQVSYTANMLCISDTEKNMERRILMIKGKNRNKIISAIVVLLLIGIIAGIVFIKTEKVDVDANAGIVSNLNEENYEKVWKEPQKFESYQEYRDYNENLGKEKFNDVNGKISDEEKSKLISSEEMQNKAESILQSLGMEEKIISSDLYKNHIEDCTYVYEEKIGKIDFINFNAENGEFLSLYNDKIVTKQLKEDKLTFDEAKKKAEEIYENFNFLQGKYSLYSIVEMQHAYGVGVLDKSGIQYESNQWNATFYENSNPNGLNKYKQLLINFFVSDGKTYITFIGERNITKVQEHMYKFDMQNNTVQITEEKAIEIAKAMDKKISGKDIEAVRTTLVNNEVNEYVWLQEKSHGEDTGFVSEKEIHDGSSYSEEELKDKNIVTTASTHNYNQYYYPEKIIRNTYEVKIDYSGEIIIDESKPYSGDDSNGNIGRIYYVDCTTGEIIGGRNYGNFDVTIEGEYMENGESRMATKNIFYDVTTGEKVAERNFNYSQEVIDNFMKKN